MLPITTTIDTSIHVYVHANTTHTHTQVHTRALLLCYFHCSVRKKATTS